MKCDIPCQQLYRTVYLARELATRSEVRANNTIHFKCLTNHYHLTVYYIIMCNEPNLFIKTHS
jgi:hypothetical protein